MSKKTLLNEATVRRFMKLANTQPLADSFVNEYGMTAKAHEDEEEAPEDMGPMDEPMGDEPMDEPMADAPMDEPMDADEPAADEPEADMDMDGDAEEVEISEDERDVLAKAAKIMMKIGGGDMDMGDMDMADEAGMRDMMEEEAVEEDMHGKKDDEEPMEEDMHGKKDEDDDAMEEAKTLDEDELVQEVTRRVAEKLRAAIKK